jgi:hypothetical protein
LLGDLLTKNLGNRAPVFIQHLTAFQWSSLLKDLISEKQLQDMTEETLNQMLAYLNSETLSPNISLQAVKKDLAGPAGLNFVMAIIQAQPDCTFQELARILTTLGSGELCNPPKALLDLFQPVIQSELRVAVAAIPDELPLLPNANDPSILSTLQFLKLARLIMRLSPLVPVGLLLVISLLYVRTLRAWLHWWGWLLLLTGLPGVFIGFWGSPLLRLLAERLLFKKMVATWPPEIVSSVRGIVDASLREVLRAAGWEALALSIIGLGMVLGQVILAHAQRKRLAASEAKTHILL